MRYRECGKRCIATAADLKTGQKACISELGRGRGFRAKMLGMGIRPGVEMTMLNSHSHGPCVIEVGRNKLMLGFEMLSGIILKGEE
ncbi:MAG: ferrous iron transport protein A [Spirochaetales bacterium]|nr:ferrous iron transport protein A [Spirochaetales bacterium]